MSDIMDIMGTVMNTLSLMLGGIAGISLLVGGIGIMNIMLVSVTERTREIGIRKAIGAQRSDITIQFMIESIFISLMGGIIGMVLSIIILSVLNVFVTEVTFVIFPSVALLALSFSIAVGLIFGIYPANKAAKLKPINALRYE
jgi:putative ABC transport system permease protein